MVAAGAAPAPDAAIVGSLIGQLVGWLVGLGMLVVMLSFQLVFLTVRRLTLTYSMLPTTSIFFQFLSAAIVVMLSLLSSLLPLWLVLRSLQPSLLLPLPYLANYCCCCCCLCQGYRWCFSQLSQQLQLCYRFATVSQHFASRSL